MQKQIITCVNQGMTRDVGISQLSEKQANYAFENHNIRITAVNDNTLYTVTNEKGTKFETSIIGVFLGSCVLKDYIVIFTKDTTTQTDYIYRLEYNALTNSINSNILYEGQLDFDLEYPIEAIGYYESEELQKVYWVDGLNPNRFINIANDENDNVPTYTQNKYQFDFQGHINSFPNITITKNYNKIGTFQSGVVQYFATYYNKYGVESCIVWQSDLQYISLQDRGGKPDESVSCCFDFVISNLDTSYDYIKIYSIYRAGLNSIAEGKIIAELEITNNDIYFTDDGTYTQNYNAEDIHYLGGQNIIASTIDYKQDTLFLGNIQLGTDENIDIFKDLFRNNCIRKTYEGIEICECPDIKWEYKKIEDYTHKIDEYQNQINNSQSLIAGFKYRELYRFGIQFMDSVGDWTQAIWIGDKYCDLPPINVIETPDILTDYGITFYYNDKKIKGYFYKLYNGTDGYLQGYYLLADLGDGNRFYYSTLNHPWRDLVEVEYTEEESIQFVESLIRMSSEYDPTSDKHKQAENIVKQEGSVEYGSYIAQATFTMPVWIHAHISRYVGYRLLVAETSIESRRIITQGVINPTMFNYKDRENNQPFSINSWLFRPRQSNIPNRHYDTLRLQNSEHAEMQGVMSKKFPGFIEGDSDLKDNYDGFLLIFAPNYLAGCRLWYKLIYYKTDSCSDFRPYDYRYRLNEESKDNFKEEDKPLKGKEAAVVIAKANQCLKEDAGLDDIIPFNFTDFKVISENLIFKTTWDGIAAEVISRITKDVKENQQSVVLSEYMLPSGQQYKEAWKAKESGNLWAYIGLGIALAAATVATIFSFGSAAPALGALVGTTVTFAAAATAIGLSAAAGACVLAAIGSAAAISTIADQAKYQEGIDRQLAYKGIYSILEDHSLSSRRNGAKIANKLLTKMFKDWKDDNPFTLLPNNSSLGSDSNFYAMGGRLTMEDDIQKNKEAKRDSFYIDESIVSLNSPDIESIAYNIDNSTAYKLDLIGTIPIDYITTDYTMYAEQGLSNTSQVLSNLNKSVNFGYDNYEGLYNGFLYQDSIFPNNLKSDDENKDIEYIQATAAVGAYKTFMWNRNTSWSLWVPDITIKDVYGNPLQQPPAKPIKKIFANSKFSNATQYYTYDKIYSMQLDPIKVFNSEQNSLSIIQYNEDSKYYQGNIDSIVLPYENYTLIANENTTEFLKEDDEVKITLKDPIPLRYKSTPHIIIPFKWDDITRTSKLLPITSKEKELMPWDPELYASFYGITGDDTYNEIQEKIEKKGAQILGSGFKMRVPTYVEPGWDTNVYYYYEIKEKIEGSSPFDSTTLLFDLQEGDSLSGFYLVYIMYKAAPLNRQMSMSQAWHNKYNTSVTELNYMQFLELNDTIMNWMQDFEHGIAFYYIEDWDSSCGYIIESKQDGYFLKSKLDYGQGIVPNADKTMPLIAPVVNTSPLDLNWSNKVEYKKILAGKTIVEPREENEGYVPAYYTNGGWCQDKLDWEVNSPYLFLGELVKKDFDYNSWYKGNTDYALQQLNWNVCSAITPITNNIESTWGDTYYQRWECLKTYPYSEQEVNSNVEVLSFMLESHTNLDGRSDVNRGTSNLLNLRPSNTNLFNTVYSQQDNFFSYKVLDQKFSKNKFENQIVWSLSKSNLDNIDKWTNIHAINALQLDGKLGSINKIINMNDTLLVFQDNGISTIDYNLKSALTTYEGVPLQMGNTGKVTGYTKITSDIGCHNKWAICLTEAGIFFIDSYKKALYVIAPNVAPTNISSTKYFSTWFKENVNNDVWNPNTNIQAFRLNYDSNTKDLYISNNNTCLLYNTEMQMFTSFMDYVNTPLLINIDSKSIAFQQNRQNNFIYEDPEIKVWSLFEGEYNDIYGQKREYSIEYRLNPSPYTDNMFTNYQYIADWTSDDQNDFLSKSAHFDIVKAWDEYQSGELSANTGVGIQPLKTKFRIWRGDIPRDGDTKTKRVLKGDRIRNPWIHLKFTKDNIDNTKMTFHNLNVTYYN